MTVVSTDEEATGVEENSDVSKKITSSSTGQFVFEFYIINTFNQKYI